MRAIVANGYGGPEVLEFKEVPTPTPADNEVLVKIHATTVTRADVMMRTGKPYIGRLFIGLFKPKHPIPGTGFAGEVVSVGKEVTNFVPGDKVFGETTTGFSTNAEYVNVKEDGVILKMGEQMRFEEAATLTDGPLTSFNFLSEIAKLSPGQRVLINGASGSLGTSAVQIARNLGAHVTAVCSGRNAGLVRSLGADEVIDYTSRDFTSGKEQYDLIFDTVGASDFESSRKVLRFNGLYLSPVLSMKLLIQGIRTASSKGQRAAFAATGMRKDEELRSMLEQVQALYNEGKLKVVIDRQYPLEKVAEAHRYVMAGHKKGNVVIHVQAN